MIIYSHQLYHFSHFHNVLTLFFLFIVFLFLKLFIFYKYFLSHIRSYLQHELFILERKLVGCCKIYFRRCILKLATNNNSHLSCGIHYLIKLLHLKQMDNLAFSYKSRKVGLCLWHAIAITIDFQGDENIRMSYGIDNLERADLKINLKSLYTIYKKLLSISYQHNTASVCGHCRKFLTVFRDILSQSELLSGFLNLVP